jgi:hypothetical protein
MQLSGTKQKIMRLAAHGNLSRGTGVDAALKNDTLGHVTGETRAKHRK